MNENKIVVGKVGSGVSYQMNKKGICIFEERTKKNANKRKKQ